MLQQQPAHSAYHTCLLHSRHRPRCRPPTNLHGQLDGRGYLTPIEPLLLLYATELMRSVSVSFRSARAAVNVNETRYYKTTIHAASHSFPPQFYGTWAVGKEPDALSKLLTGGIFHVQKNCYMLVGGCIPLILPLDPPLHRTTVSM